MRLNAKILENVNNVNSYKYTGQAYLNEGSTNTVYIQLVDGSKSVSDSSSKHFPDNPLRYLSQATALSVTATFPSIDDSSVFTVAGIQPYADDKSIWVFNLTSSQLPSSGSFQISVVEDGNNKTFTVINAIIVELSNVGGC